MENAELNGMRSEIIASIAKENEGIDMEALEMLVDQVMSRVGDVLAQKLKSIDMAVAAKVATMSPRVVRVRPYVVRALKDAWVAREIEIEAESPEEAVSMTDDIRFDDPRWSQPETIELDACVVEVRDMHDNVVLETEL